MIAKEESNQTSIPRDVYHCPSCGMAIIRAPVLQCGQCSILHSLRCFYYRTAPGAYVAECIDLDLISEGQTADDAIGRLQEAMYGYLEATFDGQPIDGLILRPSPFSHRLRYHWHRLKECLNRLSSPKHKHYVPVNRVGSITGCG